MTEGDLRELDREAFIEHQLAGYQKVPLDQIRLWPHLFAELATRQPVDPARVAALAGLPTAKTLPLLREIGAECDPGGERLIGFGFTSVRNPATVST
jgi:hypothetical protein